MAGYTEEANIFIESLVKEGYLKGDIYTKFVKGGKEVVYPVIGEDGRPHLARKVFKEAKEA
jgi:hypothetical protein